MSERNEICVSGIATLRKTASHIAKNYRKREHGLIIWSTKQTPQTITKKENLGGYHLETVSGRHFANGVKTRFEGAVAS